MFTTLTQITAALESHNSAAKTIENMINNGDENPILKTLLSSHIRSIGMLVYLGDQMQLEETFKNS